MSTTLERRQATQSVLYGLSICVVALFFGGRENVWSIATILALIEDGGMPLINCSILDSHMNSSYDTGPLFPPRTSHTSLIGVALPRKESSLE